MDMTVMYESLIHDSENRIMDILTSNIDTRFKVVELYNELIGGKCDKRILVESTPPDVGLALGLKGTTTLYDSLVIRVNAKPENLINCAWLRTRHDVKTTGNMLHLSDITKISEYHWRKKCYYDVIYYLDTVLANYEITDSDVVDIMDFDMGDDDKLRLIVLRRFYDRQENGLNAELDPSKVMEMQQRFANIIGQSVTCDNYNPREIKGYLRALELVVQWMSFHRRRDAKNEI